MVGDRDLAVIEFGVDDCPSRKTYHMYAQFLLNLWFHPCSSDRGRRLVGDRMLILGSPVLMKLVTRKDSP